MVAELARMAVVIKSQHGTSVMTGNYELAYACGLMARLSGRKLPAWKSPKELLEGALQMLESYEPEEEREKNVIHMLRYYHPDDTCDEQMRMLLEWGQRETRPWQAILTETDSGGTMP